MISHPRSRRRSPGRRAGAFASSFRHDSHNLLVVGRDPVEMAAAANVVHRMGRGLAVTEGRRLVAALALPIRGLLSDALVDQVARDGVLSTRSPAGA